MQVPKLPKYPSIYEINTRPWLNGGLYGSKTLTSVSKVPGAFWRMLAAKGMDLVWLMGIWSCRFDLAGKYGFDERLVHAYKQVLPDWSPRDVIGSPYAIDTYEVNRKVGTKATLKAMKNKLNALGMRLILDFVPNHFHAESRLIAELPNAFLEGNESLLASDKVTFYRNDKQGKKILAHGKDPYFAAWQDTVQVNIFHEDSRRLLTDILLDLTDLCDGVRCDMAMLLLNEVFEKTWAKPLAVSGTKKQDSEFWKDAIDQVRQKRPDFLFIAEAYWDLEWQLQQLGFDYTYDKRLRDRLLNSPAVETKNHLRAELEYQNRSVRFLENHDEQRAITAFGESRYKAAATICYTVPGMRFYHDGQWEGKKNRVPVQLGRTPKEEINTDVKDFYEQFLHSINRDLFKNGNWRMTDVLPASANDQSYKNVFVMNWDIKSAFATIMVNYSDSPATCRISGETAMEFEPWEIKVISV